MTKAKISEYSATAGDNTDVNGVNIAEGCPPSSMNNMGREIMAALKRYQVGSDGDGVTVGGNFVVSGSTTVNTFNVDVISEKTAAAGVTIDGVLLKDTTVTANTVKASGTDSSQGKVEFFEDTDNGTNFVALQAPAAITANLTFTLPAADGTSGQVIQTNGSGALSFATPSSTSDKIEEGNSKVEVVDTGTGHILFEVDGSEVARFNPDQLVTKAGTASTPAISPTGDLNTGIFFSAANTVDIATDGVARAQINSAGDFAINAGFGSVGKAFLCRAWVNFDGTTNVAGNCTIRASGNVSSITDNGTGQYTMNFTTAMPDIDYVAVGSSGFTSTGVEGGNVGFNRLNSGAESAPTTSALRVNALSAAGSSQDQKYIYVAIFR